MAFKLEMGSEAYAPLARVIIGGLLTSIALTIFVVPAAYVLLYGRKQNVEEIPGSPEVQEGHDHAISNANWFASCVHRDFGGNYLRASAAMRKIPERLRRKFQRG